MRASLVLVLLCRRCRRARPPGRGGGWGGGGQPEAERARPARGAARPVFCLSLSLSSYPLPLCEPAARAHRAGRQRSGVQGARARSRGRARALTMGGGGGGGEDKAEGEGARVRCWKAGEALMECLTPRWQLSQMYVYGDWDDCARQRASAFRCLVADTKFGGRGAVASDVAEQGGASKGATADMTAAQVRALAGPDKVRKRGRNARPRLIVFGHVLTHPPFPHTRASPGPCAALRSLIHTRHTTRALMSRRRTYGRCARARRHRLTGCATTSPLRAALRPICAQRLRLRPTQRPRPAAKLDPEAAWKGPACDRTSAST